MLKYYNIPNLKTVPILKFIQHFKTVCVKIKERYVKKLFNLQILTPNNYAVNNLYRQKISRNN